MSVGVMLLFAQILLGFGTEPHGILGMDIDPKGPLVQ